MPFNAVIAQLAPTIRAQLVASLDLVRALVGAKSAVFLLDVGDQTVTSGAPIAGPLIEQLQQAWCTDRLASWENVRAISVVADRHPIGALAILLDSAVSASDGRRAAIQLVANQFACVLMLAQEAHGARQLTAQIAQALRAAQAGVWSLDLKSGVFKGDAEVARLLGWHLPEINADFDDVVQRLHAQDRAEFVYSVGRTTHLGARARHAFRALPFAGAKDKWLVTAFERDESAASTLQPDTVRFVGMMRDYSEQRAAELEIEMHQQQLESLVKDLRKSNRVDVLTGLANRTALNEALRTATMNARAKNAWTSLLIIDVDFFKSFNDSFGHAEGDLALKQVATEIARSTRGDDLPARFGGEEFCVFSNAEPALALKIAERVRLAVAQSSWAKRNVTVSIGVCSLQGGNSDEGVLFQRADAALYQAKAQGRDRVVVG